MKGSYNSIWRFSNNNFTLRFTEYVLSVFLLHLRKYLKISVSTLNPELKLSLFLS